AFGAGRIYDQKDGAGDLCSAACGHHLAVAIVIYRYLCLPAGGTGAKGRGVGRRSPTGFSRRRGGPGGILFDADAAGDRGGEDDLTTKARSHEGNRRILLFFGREACQWAAWETCSGFF